MTAALSATAANADPRLDAFRAPDRVTQRWNETGFVGGWSPNSGVGFFVHTGRCQHDLDLWWAQVATYLPDGRLAVGYSWGRSAEEATASTGNLEVRVVEPLERWSITYDGAGELTTVADLAAGTVGSGSARPMRWQIQAMAAAPPWNMHNVSSTGNADDWAPDMHTQQTYRATGSLIFDGATYAFDGVCYNDHSRGPRTLEAFAGDISLVAVFPDFSVHAIKVWDHDGHTRLDAGNLFAGRDSWPVRVRFAAETDMLGNPRELDITLQTPVGDPHLAMRAEALQVMSLTITDSNDNLTGIGWDAPGDPLVFTESTVRLTTQDGRVGYGNVERSMRRSHAVRPLPKTLTDRRASAAPGAIAGITGSVAR
jgi:hypothetical protein